MVTVEQFEGTHSQLKTVTKELDEEFHELLKDEKQTGKTLKQELKEDKELMELTNKGLQILENLEEVEQQVDQ